MVESLNCKIGKIPRGSLLAVIGVLWTLFIMIASFWIGDVNNRVRDNELSITGLQKDVDYIKETTSDSSDKIDRLYDKMLRQ